MIEIIKKIVAIFYREIIAAIRIGASLVETIVFVIAVILFTGLAFANQPDILNKFGSAMIWIYTLLSLLLGLDRIFQADYEDGTLEQLVLGDIDLELLVLVKATAFWVTLCFPVSVCSLLFAQFYGLSWHNSLWLFITLLIGTPSIALIGTMAAAATINVRRGGMLLALLVTPLYLPILIFGMAASTGDLAPLLLLASLLLLSLALAPIATAELLRKID